MATFILGKDAKLYHGVAGATPSTEMSNVRDVTLTLEEALTVSVTAKVTYSATPPSSIKGT